MSIGPYHNGNQQLKGMEKRKEEFQSSLKLKKEVIEDLRKELKERIEDIRKSYFDPIVEEDDELVNMMVRDGCFLLILFLNASKSLQVENSIYSMPWALPSIRRDLLLLENQIPLFVLDILLKRIHPGGKLNEIVLAFFNSSFRKNQAHNNFEATHLLDLICQTYLSIPDNLPAPPPFENSSAPSQTENSSAPSQTENSSAPSKTENSFNTRFKNIFFLYFHSAPSQTENSSAPSKTENSSAPSKTENSSASSQTENSSAPSQTENSSAQSLKLKYSAKELNNRGVTFELSNGVNTFLGLSFTNGVLNIPKLTLDDFLSVVLLNGIAFEQFYGASTNITSYVEFMGCLINSERDATYLVEKGIVQNYLGMDGEVSLFFKSILKDYVFDIKNNYLANLKTDVENYSSIRYIAMWTNCKQFYMASPWTFLSTVAALTLLLLTVAQVVMAAIGLKSTPELQVTRIG